MITNLVKFDQFAVMSFGLISLKNPGQLVPNGIGLVTSFVSGEIWANCCDPVTTTWTDSFPEPVTVWTEVSL